MVYFFCKLDFLACYCCVREWQRKFLQSTEKQNVLNIKTSFLKFLLSQMICLPNLKSSNNTHISNANSGRWHTIFPHTQSLAEQRGIKETFASFSDDKHWIKHLFDKNIKSRKWQIARLSMGKLNPKFLNP